MTAAPNAENVRRALVARARAGAITSTVYESFTITETVVEEEEGEPYTEINYYTETETFYPPDQTICEAERTVTYFYQGPAHTQYDVRTVTLYGYATVWVGQTQTVVATDYPALTRCNQGGGWYAP